MLAKPLHLPLRLVAVRINVGDVNHTLAKGECLLDRLRDAGPGVPSDDVAVHNDLDPVLTPVVDLRWLIQAVGLAVHAHPDVAGPPDLVEERLVLLLPLPLEWGHQIQLRPLRKGQYAV